VWWKVEGDFCFFVENGDFIIETIVYIGALFVKKSLYRLGAISLKNVGHFLEGFGSLP
jgi:hypothetical protein